MKKQCCLLILALLFSLNLQAQKGWTNLFNGKDLKDWTVKIAQHEVGEKLRQYLSSKRWKNGG